MLFRESGFESKRWGTRGVKKVGAKESGRTKGRRMQIKLLDSEEIKKEERFEGYFFTAIWDK